MKRATKTIFILLLIFSMVIPQNLFIHAAEIDSPLSNGNNLPTDYVDNSNENLYELLEQLSNENQISLLSSTFATNPIKVDVAFVIDSTGSMSSYIANVKNNIASFAQYLNDKGITLRLSVIEYRDITSDGLDSTIVHKTNYSPWTSITEFITTLTRISANGGGDSPETPIDGLGYLLDSSTMLWSSDAYKFAFLLTDASYKNDNRHGYTSLSDISEKLANKNIYTSVITNSIYYSTYSALTSTTNGINGNIFSSDFSKILQDFADSVLGITKKAKKAIYVLPGYLGSELYSSNSNSANILWPDIRANGLDWWQQQHDQLINENSDGNGEVAFALGKDVLSYGKDDYGAQDTYKLLIDNLKSYFDKNNDGDYDVKFFPYNWLGDINQSVIKLEEDANKYDKIILITHSTGGLVASAYIAKSRTNQLKVEKLIMIAPPLYGTYASLFPLERGDAGKGLSMIDFGTNNDWIKDVVHNSPTTYQLLPSKEYFENTNSALDIKTEDKFFPWSKDTWLYNRDWNEFYKTLNGSKNINKELLSSSTNLRSHKNFREKSVVNSNNLSIINVLEKVDTTIIGTVYGYSTPKTAQYDVSNGYDNAKLIDIKYDKGGDGTVYNTSLGVVLNESNDIVSNQFDMFTYTGSYLSHTDLVKKNDLVINTIISLIREVSDKNTSILVSNTIITPFNLTNYSESDKGMSDYVKLRIVSNKNILIRIFDLDNNIVAYCDSNVVSGFDNNDFICDRFGDNDETLTSIYMPKSGYKVKLYHGDQPDVELEFALQINLLDSDGDITGYGGYINKTTIAEGEILSLNLLNGVTEANIGKLASTDDYPDLEVVTEFYSTDWELDFSALNKPNDVVILDNIGETAVIGITGIINPNLLVWESSDESIITVDNGLLTAVGYGRAVITVNATDGSGKGKMIYAKVSLTTTSIDFNNIEMVVGERVIIEPIFDSHQVTEKYVEYRYNINDNIITIEDNVIIGLKPGIISVTGIATGGVENTFTVTVTNDEMISVQNVLINSEDINLHINDEVALTADINPNNATNQNINWYVDDNTILEIVNINSNNCIIKGIKKGTTGITVVTLDGGYNDSITVNVIGENEYILNIIASDGGIIQNDVSGIYTNGEAINIIAIADSEYEFKEWISSNGGTFNNSKSASTTFTMPNNDVTITAIFEPIGISGITKYKVNVSTGEGGTVKGNGKFIAGTLHTVTAIADKNYVFVNWTENGKVVSTDVNYKFVITSDRNLVANFKQILNKITPLPLIIGRVEGCIIIFESNGGTKVDSQTVGYYDKSIEPEVPIRDGYAFGGWYVDESCKIKPYKFNERLTQNITLYAKWIEE